MKKVLKGTICYSESLQKLKVLERGYLLIEDGISKGVLKKLPMEWKESEIIDYGDKMIIPGMVDLHIHAPQYTFSGTGMDLELLEWLDTQTFPEEAKYADLEYANKAYDIFVRKMLESATTRACIFATLHTQATLLLMEKLEASGLKTMVGKVSMDRNSPDILREVDVETAVKNTKQWLEESKKFANTRPILTPRFIPTCTDELMKELKKLQEEYELPVHSHLSENTGEIQWVQELCPTSEFYGDAYDQFGLFGGENCRTIMAHCVHSNEDEQMRMKENGVYVAHCPQSNTNLSSGIAPIRTYLDKGIKVGLGSDVAGGAHESILRAMVDAIQVSKLRWRIQDESLKPLTLEEVFYLATKGGGSFFGNVGSFEEGYEVDAIVIDDSVIETPYELSGKQRLERVVYLSDERHIVGKYVAGVKVL